MRVFFRDRGAVFFSLLSPLILFALYFVFLGNMNLADLKQTLPDVDESQLGHFLDSWVYAGIVMTAAVTTGLAALGVFVNDRDSGRFIDFAVSPLPRWKVVASYLMATVSVATIMTTIVYVAAQAHLVMQGTPLPSLDTVAQIVGRYIVIAFSFGAISSLAVTFIRSNAAFTSLSIIVGTAIGFLAGIYVPLGVLSVGVANILNALPFAQAATLLREPFVYQPLEVISQSQSPQVAQGLMDTYGLQVTISDTVLQAPTVIILLLVMGVAALLLAVMQISRKLR